MTKSNSSNHELLSSHEKLRPPKGHKPHYSKARRKIQFSQSSTSSESSPYKTELSVAPGPTKPNKSVKSIMQLPIAEIQKLKPIRKPIC